MTGVTLLRGDLSDAMARRLREERRVAVDTETSGLDWVTDRLHVCQLFSPATGVIVVHDVVGRPTALAELFADTDVVKVFHFAPFDLRFLHAQWGAPVRSVECTKAASKILFPDLPHTQHSLQALLRRMMGVEISKGPVRTSDWSAQELSDEQMRYAAADVEHLLDLADALGQRLLKLGMRRVFDEVCAYMPVDALLAVKGIPNPLDY